VGSSSKAIPDADIDIEDFNWDFISLRALSRKGQGNYLVPLWYAIFNMKK
jgi:hypothetical protein